MKVKYFQRGFNYSQDGPGNRLVYHLQGCNMRCRWCANPESIPLNGIAPYKFEEINVEELLDEANRSLMMFFDGGGVTLTGGEPTVQFEAVRRWLSGLKEQNINTAMETNAAHPELPGLFPLIDHLIMDFKHHSDEKHLKYTGAHNDIIKRNIASALEMRKQTVIRIPLIAGVNTSRDDLRGFLDFFKDKDTSAVSFEFLRYHEYGKQKWERCGMEYQMRGAFVDDKTVSDYEKAFQLQSLKVIRT